MKRGAAVNPLMAFAGIALVGYGLSQASKTGSATVSTRNGAGGAGAGGALNDGTDEGQGAATGGATFTPDASMPRGIRNNNPGNIRKSATAWQGKVGHDGSFEIFDTAQNGIRAMAKIMLTKSGRGINTVSGLITSWAPPSENNTAAYIAYVANSMGVSATQALDLRDPTTMADLIDPIIETENGYNPYDAGTVAAGVNSALGLTA